MNIYAIRAIYRFEMARTFRTVMQSIASPVLSTSLYFVVFGSAIGGRMGQVGGVDYGSFIVPGLVMLSLLSESISNASFGIYLPKWSGTIYELLSAPVSFLEVVIGYVGAAASKSIMLGVLILITARAFVPYEIVHPGWMVAFLVLTSVTFSMFGFIIGLWADSFQKLQTIPLMIVTPLTFLGGAFYSINMLPPFWQKVLFNPVVYLISGCAGRSTANPTSTSGQRRHDAGVHARLPRRHLVGVQSRRLRPEQIFRVDNCQLGFHGALSPAGEATYLGRGYPAGVGRCRRGLAATSSGRRSKGPELGAAAGAGGAAGPGGSSRRCTTSPPCAARARERRTDRDRQSAAGAGAQPGGGRGAGRHPRQSHDAEQQQRIGDGRRSTATCSGARSRAAGGDPERLNNPGFRARCSRGSPRPPGSRW
jgi:ABC-2 type transport system permease protein